MGYLIGIAAMFLVAFLLGTEARIFWERIQRNKPTPPNPENKEWEGQDLGNWYDDTHTMD